MSGYVPPIVYCPTCAQDTIPSRAGFCLFCDTKIVVGEPRATGNGSEVPSLAADRDAPSASTRADTAAVTVASSPTTARPVHTIDTLAATLLERVKDGAPHTAGSNHDLHSAGRYHGIRWSDLLAHAGLPENKVGRPRKAA